MYAKSYKVASPLLSYTGLLSESQCLTDHEKQSLFELLRAYADTIDDPKKMASEHLHIVVDVESACAQMQYRCDEQELEVDKLYGTEYANARHDIKDAGKVTEEHLRNLVQMSIIYVTARRRLNDLRRVLGVLQGLKKNLYNRAELIRIMAAKDREIFG